jgi:hypothetical protein
MKSISPGTKNARENKKRLALFEYMGNTFTSGIKEPEDVLKGVIFVVNGYAH